MDQKWCSPIEVWGFKVRKLGQKFWHKTEYRKVIFTCWSDGPCQAPQGVWRCGQTSWSNNVLKWSNMQKSTWTQLQSFSWGPLLTKCENLVKMFATLQEQIPGEWRRIKIQRGISKCWWSHGRTGQRSRGTLKFESVIFYVFINCLGYQESQEGRWWRWWKQYKERASGWYTPSPASPLNLMTMTNRMTC